MKREILLFALALAASFLLLELVLRARFEPAPIWREPQIRHLDSPLLGWALPPGSRAYTIDAPVQVNSLGLRDDEFPRAKPSGEVRILALGDSFTFALGVHFEDLYVQRLERLLRRHGPPPTVQVINAGIAGYNTRQELILLRTLGLELEPDLILVAFYWNDLIGNEAPLPDLDNTPRFEADAQQRELEPHLLPTSIRNALRRSQLLYQVVTRGKRLAALIRPPDNPYHRVQRALLEGDYETLEPYWQQAGLRLQQIAGVARQRGIPALLVVFPMENTIRQHFPRLVFAERLDELWTETGMPFLDLTPLYREALEQGHNPFLPYDLHPGPEGMEIAAQAIYQAIVARGLLPLPSREAGAR